MNRKCELCKEKKPISEFHPNGSGGRSKHCKKCHFEISVKFMEARCCDECGSNYTARSEKQKYCSKKCQQRFYNKKRYNPVKKKTKPCAYCGDKFKGSGYQKYCNPSCAKSQQYKNRINDPANKPNHRVCPDCGIKKQAAEFYEDNASTSGLSYRCKKCDLKKKKKSYKPAKKKTKLCAYCGDKFKGSGHQKYCGKECLDEAALERKRNVLHEITCEGCGEKAMVNEKDSKHCSPECYFEKSMLWPSKDFTKRIIRQRVGNLKNMPDSLVRAYRAKLQLKREIKHKKQ